MLGLVILEKLSEQAHPDLAASLFNLARLYAVQSKAAEAQPRFERALELYESTLGPTHPDVLVVRDGYAKFLRDSGRNDEAERLTAASR